jgi:hypothetical protein
LSEIEGALTHFAADIPRFTAERKRDFNVGRVAESLYRAK